MHRQVKRLRLPNLSFFDQDAKESQLRDWKMPTAAQMEAHFAAEAVKRKAMLARIAALWEPAVVGRCRTGCDGQIMREPNSAPHESNPMIGCTGNEELQPPRYGFSYHCQKCGAIFRFVPGHDPMKGISDSEY